MGFRGEEYAFGSPAAAVAGMIARIDAVMGAGRAQATHRVPLSGSSATARGRVLAEDIRADRDSPPFDCSSMDGYAVHAGELAALRGAGGSGDAISIRVTGEARVGMAPPARSPRDKVGQPTAVRIATGAPIPPETDCVIKREDVLEHVEDGVVTTITISTGAAANVRSGDYIRRRGENTAAGAFVLRKGTVLTAAAIGTLAAVGAAEPLVYAPMRVAIITTGDELAPPPTPTRDVGAFRIRDSNAVALAAALSAHAWITVNHIVHVADDGEDLARVLHHAARKVDAVVLAGGISMGHRDLVRAAVESLGAVVVFHGLPQRPGKPMLGAVLARDAIPKGRDCLPIFGLPGNPVSALVTCARIVVPVLAACAGASCGPAPPHVALANTDGKAINLWWHRLVRLNDAGEAELTDNRGSGDIIAAGSSDGFVEVPPAGGSECGPESGSGARGEAPAPKSLAYFPWPK